MELNQQDIDLLDRFISGKLNAEELTEFNRRMKEDVDFSEEVKSYLEATSVINNLGRNDLRIELKKIKTELDLTGDYEKYNPRNGKSGSGIIFFILFSLITALIFYLAHSGFIKLNFSGELNDPATKDTVYHYQLKIDTVYKNQYDSTATITILNKGADTVYFDEKGNYIDGKSAKSKKKESTNRKSKTDTIKIDPLFKTFVR